VVVEAGALELAVAEREPERLDQVQLGAGVRREPDHVARVGRDLGMDEHDREHRGASRRRRARDDPRLDVRGAGAAQRRRRGRRGRAGRHHVVDEREPRAVERRDAANAPRTLRSRSRHGRRACGAPCLSLTSPRASGSPVARESAFAISRAWLQPRARWRAARAASAPGVDARDRARGPRRRARAARRAPPRAAGRPRT
jgi:hypothetical protein